MVSVGGVVVLNVTCLGMVLVFVCALMVEIVCVLTRLTGSTMGVTDCQYSVLEDAWLFCFRDGVSLNAVQGNGKCPLLACTN